MVEYGDSILKSIIVLKDNHPFTFLFFEWLNWIHHLCFTVHSHR